MSLSYNNGVLFLSTTPLNSEGKTLLPSIDASSIVSDRYLWSQGLLHSINPHELTTTGTPVPGTVIKDACLEAVSTDRHYTSIGVSVDGEPIDTTRSIVAAGWSRVTDVPVASGLKHINKMFSLSVEGTLTCHAGDMARETLENVRHAHCDDDGLVVLTNDNEVNLYVNESLVQNYYYPADTMPNAVPVRGNNGPFNAYRSQYSVTYMLPITPTQHIIHVSGFIGLNNVVTIGVTDEGRLVGITISGHCVPVDIGPGRVKELWTGDCYEGTFTGIDSIGANLVVVDGDVSRYMECVFQFDSETKVEVIRETPNVISTEHTSVVHYPSNHRIKRSES